MGGIVTTVGMGYTLMPMLPLSFDADGTDADDVNATQTMAFAAAGDSFEEEASPAAVAVMERPVNTPLGSIFHALPPEFHAMVVGKGDPPASALEPIAMTVNTSSVPIDKRKKLALIVRPWNHLSVGFIANVFSLWGCAIFSSVIPKVLNLHLSAEDQVALLGGSFAAAQGLLMITGTIVYHGGDWLQLIERTCFSSSRQQMTSIKDVLAQPIAKQVLGSEISQEDYRSALSANVSEWNKLNPVEQSAYLRADRRSGLDDQEKPIVLQSRATPVSVGFTLQRLLERFHGLGGVGAQREMDGASPELSKWHGDYLAKLENGGEDTTKFRTDKSHIPAMAIGAKLAAIPAARRALRGVPRKQYEGMVKAVIKEWKTLNPVQRGTLHIADRLMGIATEEHGIDISPSWWTISTGFALMRMIGRLGLADVVAEGASKGPGVWYQRYSAYLAEASTHPLDLSVKKGMDSKSVISAHLLQIPEVRSALLNLSMKEYRAVIDRITSEWRKTNEVSQIDHLETDKKNGLLSDIDQEGLISPGYIARLFCERYLGMGEKAVRERFKLDAKVREKLEAWYRSYRKALDGVSV